jgi:uncharacterized protein (DUF433 family)
MIEHRTEGDDLVIYFEGRPLLWVNADRHSGDPCLYHTRLPARIPLEARAKGMLPQEVEEGHPDASIGEQARLLRYCAELIDNLKAQGAPPPRWPLQRALTRVRQAQDPPP